MTRRALPRICIAAGASSSGKTTFACGLLRALMHKNLKPAAFKCGPDYIDPMFHRRVIGAKSSNLDLFFFGGEIARYLMWENSNDCDIAVVEGVMGYYDGLGGKTTEASTWHLARETETPVILIQDCKGMSVSAAAAVKGFTHFEQTTANGGSNIQGVILNRAPASLYPDLKELIEKETGIPVLGYLPFLKDSVIGSRHLGLVTADEIEDLAERIDRVADQIAETVDVDEIIRIAAKAPMMDVVDPFESIDDFDKMTVSETASRPRIGIARDAAFCFYYEDSLKLLEKFGAELVDFSPLNDAHLPEGLSGLYLGGGYPELYLPQLQKNANMRREIKKSIQSGLPTIAECGGFMYLHEAVSDANGKTYEMTGAIEGECKRTSGLVRFGYASYRSLESGLICAKGEAFRGHEFHYWDSSREDQGFCAMKAGSDRTWKCILNNEGLYAGFPHLHFYAAPQAANRFLKACKEYGQACKKYGQGSESAKTEPCKAAEQSSESMPLFKMVNGKKMRYGYTTGTCAAAAAKAATAILLSGLTSSLTVPVEIKTPSGRVLTLAAEDVRIIEAGRHVSCAVRKDSGDDPDVTNGILVYADVRKTTDAKPDIHIDGGEGIGRITKPGLDQPVGAAAINSTPRRMIEESISTICDEYGFNGGLDVLISIPGGEELAAKTFNPRLGIVGGISVLGTGGIVEPMSDDALVKTIRAEFSVRKAEGAARILITPGNYGSDFLKGFDRRPSDIPIKCSNFIGDSIDMAAEFGFGQLLLVGHIGKLIKLVTGNFNTHSKYGDPRSEVLISAASLCGGSKELCGQISACATTEAVLELLEANGLVQPVITRILEKIQEQMDFRSRGNIETGAVIFSSRMGYLGATKSGGDMLNDWERQE